MPRKAVQGLLTYMINPEKCVGCHACAVHCPAEAIEGMPRKPHAIIFSKCIKCGMCMSRCKFKAVTVR